MKTIATGILVTTPNSLREGYHADLKITDTGFLALTGKAKKPCPITGGVEPDMMIHSFEESPTDVITIHPARLAALHAWEAPSMAKLHSIEVIYHV